MPASEFMVDTVRGTINPVSTGGIGTPQEFITIGSDNYYLHGDSLVSETADITSIPLAPDNASLVTTFSNGTVQISTPVEQRAINRPGGRIRAYGLAGDVRVSLGNGELRTVTIDNTLFTKVGRRLAMTEDTNHNIQYFESEYTYSTNEELQAKLGDPNARFLTPQESMREVVTRYLLRNEEDLLTRYAAEHPDDLPSNLKALSGAAQFLANNADISELQVISNFYIRP